MKREPPIISFIVAVYNNEKYIPKATHSITNQIINNPYSVEIIIVDDGSTDNTPYIVDQLANEDERIKVIHQTNQWIFASFNNGIKAASGEYIYILNSDDKMHEGSVQTLLNSVNKYNRPDVIWTKVVWQDVDENQHVLHARGMNESIVEDEYITNIDEIHYKWLDIQKAGLIVNQANLYKRELALLHPFRTDIYGADTFFNLRIADDLHSMVILKDDIYLYLAYNSPSMNASVGKYYDYDHTMFTEMMFEEYQLYKKWGCQEECFDFVVLKRLRGITHEIKALGYSNCVLPWKDRIEKIFRDIADPLIRTYAQGVGREREYESRILNGTRELLINNNVTKDIPEFVSVLIKYLPDDFRNNVDRGKIDKKAVFDAVNNYLNKDRIGERYYTVDW